METTITLDTLKDAPVLGEKSKEIFQEKGDYSVENKQILNFNKITPEDMPLIWEFLEKEKGRTTDFSYGGLLMWVDLFKYEFAIYKDTLFIKGVVENDMTKPAFSLPLGSMPLNESIKLLQEYCKKEGIATELSAVPEYAITSLQEAGALYIELLENWSDYLYDAETLATVKGKKMSKKRNHINYFENHHPEWYYEELTEKNVDEVLRFMNLYDAECDEDPMTKEESILSRKIIDLVGKGNPVMKGGVLYSEPGRICSIAIGDVKGDTLFVHIEKGLKSVAGSYEMINREFAAQMIKKYPQINYINREDDGGDEGLRRAKESYHPIALLRKYNVIL